MSWTHLFSCHCTTLCWTQVTARPGIRAPRCGCSQGVCLLAKCLVTRLASQSGSGHLLPPSHSDTLPRHGQSEQDRVQPKPKMVRSGRRAADTGTPLPPRSQASPAWVSDVTLSERLCPCCHFYIRNRGTRHLSHCVKEAGWGGDPRKTVGVVFLNRTSICKHSLR